jgi:hypothetical protein
MKKNSFFNDDKGMVAITITIIFILVISLTSLALARFARREQRQALDNQLATEALYLAEAGINDGKRAISLKEDGFGNPNPYYVGDKTNCNPDNTWFPQNLDFLSQTSTQTNSSAIRSGLGDISAEGSYSCVLIDHTPQTVEYTEISTDKSTYADMTIVDPATGTPVTNYYLIISWQRTDNTANFRPVGSTEFVPKPDWNVNTTGVLRVDLTRIHSAAFDSNYLSANTMTSFLYPTPGPALPPAPGLDFTGSMGPSLRGSIAGNACSVGVPPPLPPSTKFCKIRIANIGQAHVFMRLKMIYNSASVSLSAFDATTDARLEIRGAQTVIDSTGKVNDVVKRLQVRVGTRPTINDYPEYAAESIRGICKRMRASPGLTGLPYEGHDVHADDINSCNPALL